MHRIKWTSVFLVAAMVGAGLSPAMGETGLLESTVLRPAGGLKDGPTENVLRQRAVTVSPDLLASNESVQLDLFEDTVLTARKTDQVERGPGHYSWFGELEGQSGTVNIVVYGDGLLMAQINTDDRCFTITHGGEGIHSVKEIDRYAFASETDDGVLVPPSPRVAPGNGSALPMADDGSIIDVLVVISDGVLDTFDAATQEEDADAFAQLGVDVTNTGYAQSDVFHRLRLVDRRMVEYDDPSHSQGHVLGDLGDGDDNVIDVIHDWRDECAADIVSFWVLGYSNSDICGRANIMSYPGPGFAEYAFNTVDYDCIEGYFSFGHEVGHNMGCRHDVDADSRVLPYPFCHGWQDPDSLFRTVMATNCSPSCPRRNQFSNPDIYYGGEGVDCSGSPLPPECRVTGSVTDEDCARTMDLTAPIVANFRDSAGGTCVCECESDADCDDEEFCNGYEICNSCECEAGTPPDCDDGVDCTVDTCNESSDSCDHTLGDCDDPLWCNGVETCDPELDCVSGTPPDCDDGVDCTVDACNESSDSCDHTPGDCDDGLWCNGAEICDPELDCVSGTPPDCSDDIACTIDVCDPATDDCDNSPNHAVCDDGDFCNGVEICDIELGCLSGDPEDCDDEIACTYDSCKGDACLHRDICPKAEACRWSTGECLEACSSNADCDDGDPCTFDKCLYDITQPQGFCNHANHC